MNTCFFPFDQIPYLSKRDVDFQMNPNNFHQFLGHPFSIEGFRDKINERKTYPVNRSALVEVIISQYKKANIEDYPIDLIELLKEENTFTVVTAHQPSLFTGPLYYIYKILSAINLAERLNDEFADANVLPVFIIGSEDHDFEEVNHLQLFNKEIVWDSQQTGPVGRMNTQDLKPVLEEISEILGQSEHAEELKDILHSSFGDLPEYNIGVLRLVHSLFKKFNLICLIADHQDLKREIIPVIKADILENVSKSIVEKSQTELEQLGYKSQAYAREINFFYLLEGKRERIERDGNIYSVLNTGISFTKEEIIEEIEKYPDRFSPNVIMRPIYQEMILPNLAYLGGGGELAYWTERKRQFEHFKVSYPILVRRNSLLWIGSGEVKTMEKLGLGLEQIFEHEDSIVKEFVKNNSQEELEFGEEFSMFNAAYEKLVEKAGNIDQSLQKAILAAQTKQFKTFEQLSSRLIRAEKDNFERSIQKIKKLKAKLFPNDGLQERIDNFMPFYLKYGPEYFDLLKAKLDPFNPEFIVLLEE